jgi:hypothetical protein
MRQELSNELIEVINEFAPKLYKDFDQARSCSCSQPSALANGCCAVANSRADIAGPAIERDADGPFQANVERWPRRWPGRPTPAPDGACARLALLTRA